MKYEMRLRNLDQIRDRLIRKHKFLMFETLLELLDKPKKKGGKK